MRFDVEEALVGVDSTSNHLSCLLEVPELPGRGPASSGRPRKWGVGGAWVPHYDVRLVTTTARTRVEAVERQQLPPLVGKEVHASRMYANAGR